MNAITHQRKITIGPTIQSRREKFKLHMRSYTMLTEPSLTPRERENTGFFVEGRGKQVLYAGLVVQLLNYTRKNYYFFISNFFISDKLSYIDHQKLKEHFPFFDLLCGQTSLNPSFNKTPANHTGYGIFIPLFI